MSFLDEREQGPPTPGSRRGPRGPRRTDRQTIVVRQAVALGGLILFLLVAVVGVRGCLDARQERAFKDYLRDINALIDESEQQSEDLFGLLRRPMGQSEVELENSVNERRAQAEQLVDRARATDHPGDLNTAHTALVQVLEFRRDGIAGVARLLPNALVDDGKSQAVADMAGQMLNFLTSDVIYSQRAVPALRAALRRAEITGEQVLTGPRTQFLPDLNWIRTRPLADRIARIGGSSTGDGALAPGPHGTGLGPVAVQPGDVTLSTETAADLRASDRVSFDVQVTNQGASPESDVDVRITIAGAGAPMRREATIADIAAGATETVSIPLAGAPPVGRPVDIRVSVAPVRGEVETGNNRAAYKAIFTR